MVTLADFRARQVSLHWAEAVAIIRAVIELMPRGDASGTRVPDPGEIQVHSDGTIAILGLGPAAKDAVQRVARIFDSLVAEHELPVQLRLVSVTALSATGPYESVADFYNALEPFERPNRVAQIASAYGRYQGALAAGARPADDGREEKYVKPVVKSEPRQKRQGPPLWKRKRFAFAVALVLAAGAAGSAWWWLSKSGALGRFDVQQVRTAVTETASAVTAAVAAGAENVASRIGLGSPTQAAAETPEAAVEATASKPAPAMARKSISSFPAGGAGGGVSRPAALAVPMLPYPPEPSWPSRALAEARAEEAARRLRALVEPEPPDLTIVHSASDPDIEPPALVRPQLPLDPPPGRRLEDLPLLEMVVSEEGRVESVKLLTPPRGVHDVMMLSAAKAWLFQPARKAGAAVRCRTLVRITLP